MRLGSLLLGLTLVLAAAPARAFDEARAFVDLQALVRLGPRIPGSNASAKARELICERLRQAGWKSESQKVQARFADGREVEIENVWARFGAPDKPIVMVVTHYDTKPLASGGSPGANDGASGTALLLELARTIATPPAGAEIWLVFFDASKPTGPRVTSKDGLYGSRAFVRKLEADGDLARVRALVYVDRVADRSLQLSPGPVASRTLAAELRHAARAVGDDKALDLEPNAEVPADYRAFRERGFMEVVSVADHRLGQGPPPGELYESPRDDLGAASTESLGRAGAVVRRLIHQLATM